MKTAEEALLEACAEWATALIAADERVDTFDGTLIQEQIQTHDRLRSAAKVWWREKQEIKNGEAIILRFSVDLDREMTPEEAIAKEDAEGEK